MVRVLWMLLCVATPAHAAAEQISVRADKTDLVLGEALSLEIRLQGADKQAIESFTLDALQQDFDVAALSRSVRERAAIVTATLVPLRRGKQVLPALQFLGARSAPIALNVRDEGPQVPRVLIRTGIEPSVPRVREAARVVLEVLDNGSLQWAPIATPDAPGMHLRALAETQRDEMVDGVKFVAHRYAWAVLPLRDGQLQIQFPRLHATKFGARLRYAVSPLIYSAEPIPAWLPVHVPVGAPQVSSDELPASIETQRPFNWQLRVTGAGLSEEGIAKVIGAALHGNDALFFYPPTVQLAAAPRTIEAQQTFLVTIPLRILRSGDIDLPRIVFPYYDITREQLDAVRLDAPRVTAINPVARVALRIVIGLLVLLAGAAITVFLWRIYRRARRRAMALHRVRSAVDVAQLKAALLRFDVGDDGAPAATLQQWLRQARSATAELSGLVRQLECACYGLLKPECELHVLQSGIVAELKRIKRATS